MTNVIALKRILNRLNKQIIILENNPILSLSDAEVHDLKDENYDNYFAAKIELKELKEEHFYLEMQIIKITVLTK